VAQMLYSNRLARTPSVQYILSHAGDVIPYLAGRFAIVDEMNVVRGGDIRGTVAQRPSVPGMSWASLRWCLARTIPISEMGVRSVEHMRRTTAPSEAERQAILQGNAQRLFPRLSHVLVA
jgi:6-methylsalicylate decarboxylase